ncbi:hypothetical protein BIW11_04418 [Tropilaelaps mercedesae]|uniref:Uncharacterized protein n=1 Tax=Tropilaelaps mercedesae TaxID=418985 RepID=A0A1V9X752_9ACAR|nr:hypothetical protein BIW11_04418 [Tropilaelaps mercedesae]
MKPRDPPPPPTRAQRRTSNTKHSERDQPRPPHTQAVGYCERYCEKYCGRYCEGYCERYCESYCRKYCEKYCESYCRKYCEKYCGRYCERYCESYCGKYCERYCESYCGKYCERYCGKYCGKYCGRYCERCVVVTGGGILEPETIDRMRFAEVVAGRCRRALTCNKYWQSLASRFEFPSDSLRAFRSLSVSQSYNEPNTGSVSGNWYQLAGSPTVALDGNRRNTLPGLRQRPRRPPLWALNLIFETQKYTAGPIQGPGGRGEYSTNSEMQYRPRCRGLRAVVVKTDDVHCRMNRQTRDKQNFLEEFCKSARTFSKYFRYWRRFQISSGGRNKNRYNSSSVAQLTLPFALSNSPDPMQNSPFQRGPEVQLLEDGDLAKRRGRTGGDQNEQATLPHDHHCDCRKNSIRLSRTQTDHVGRVASQTPPHIGIKAGSRVHRKGGAALPPSLGRVWPIRTAPRDERVFAEIEREKLAPAEVQLSAIRLMARSCNVAVSGWPPRSGSAVAIHNYGRFARTTTTFSNTFTESHRPAHLGSVGDARHLPLIIIALTRFRSATSESAARTHVEQFGCFDTTSSSQVLAIYWQQLPPSS